MHTEKTENLIEHYILRTSLKSEQPHYILITIKEKSSYYIDDSLQHQIGTIDIQATYLTGPTSRDNLISGHISSMGGSIDSYNKLVSITNGSVMVQKNFRGLGIGSFMFDVIIKWALKLDPSFKVSTIKVAEVDATEENQARRNKFYANFGIEFGKPMNEGVVEGLSAPIFVQNLKSHNGWTARLERLDHLSGLWAIGDEIQSLLLNAQCHKDQIKNLKEELTNLRRLKSRKTIIKIGATAVFILMLLTIIIKAL